MLDRQLSWAGVYSLLNYSGPQSVIINRLHSTFGAHCQAEKKETTFPLKSLQPDQWRVTNGATVQERGGGKIKKGDGKGSFPGRVGFYSGCGKGPRTGAVGATERWGGKKMLEAIKKKKGREQEGISIF